MQSPEGELSRVDSPQNYSNFIGTQIEEREDTHVLLTTQQDRQQAAPNTATRESHIGMGDEIIHEVPESSTSSQV